VIDRVEVLLQKLQDQYRRKASPEQLLLTVQMLQAELLLQKSNIGLKDESRKVSVILPNNLQLNSGNKVDANAGVVEKKEVQVLQVDEKEIEAELEELKKNAELKNEMSLKGRQPISYSFDPMEEVPTLSAQPGSVSSTDQKKDINESISQDESSLNEKLKDSKGDLAEKLKDTPIKDLRKAIGINDRYLYINNLFLGDESMFERSVKTLNNFSILPEAEYWMQRELRMKLGWKEDNLLAQQFIQLVRRRFS
jgi:hypothetical protein